MVERPIPLQEIQEILELVREDPAVSAEEVATLSSIATGNLQPTVPLELLDPTPSDSAASISGAKTVVPGSLPSKEEELPPDIRTQLAEASFSQKVKLALLGNVVCRMVLIRDSNKLIQQLVLKNPRLTPSEVEDFARNKNVSEQVLRAIAANKAWMKQYKVKLNLVCNPKTPGDLALKWLRFLNQGDLRNLARSKNVSNVVSTTARKLVQDAEGKN